MTLSCPIYVVHNIVGKLVFYFFIYIYLPKKKPIHPLTNINIIYIMSPFVISIGFENNTNEFTNRENI